MKTLVALINRTIKSAMRLFVGAENKALEIIIIMCWFVQLCAPETNWSQALAFTQFLSGLNSPNKQTLKFPSLNE